RAGRWRSTWPASSPSSAFRRTRATTAACWPCCITWGGNRSFKTGDSRYRLAMPEDGVGDVGLLEALYLLLGQRELAGGQGVGDVPEPGGADDGRGHAGTAEQPGQRDLGRRRAALRGDLREPVRHVEVGAGVIPLVRQRVVSGPGGLALTLAVP